MRPAIGITTSVSAGERGSRLRCYVNAAYVDAVVAAGGYPLPLTPPPSVDPAYVAEALDRIDGLLFTGGPDLDPAHYGQSRHPQTEVMHERRDRFDLALFRAADAARIPILTICLGCQIASVARGGCLVQHVDDLPRSSAVLHHAGDAGTFHTVEILPDSRLAQVVGATRMEVNSRHHQVVSAAQVGAALRAVAFAPDGVVEAAEDCDGRFLLAVQWHPEDLVDRPEHLRLFQSLVAESRAAARAPASSRPPRSF